MVTRHWMVRAESGFTLAELLVATTLMLIVTGIVVALVAPAQATTATRPETIDMQQRARVGLDMMRRDLALAGAGLDAGPAVGSLGAYFAAVVPRRMGLQNADAANTARADAITIAYVPRTSVQTLSAALLTSPALDLQVSSEPGCPLGRALCGISVGASLVVFDAVGHADAFTATQIGAAARLAHHAADAAWPYPAGSYVAAFETHTYYLDVTTAQLRHYDGYLTDTPVIDHVVGLTFSYLGDARPPAAPRPPMGTSNCLYSADGSPRPLAVLGSGDTLVSLPIAMLGDGPWCGVGSSQFDADLLRVRLIRVVLRVEAASSTMRASGVGFARPGVTRRSATALVDYVVTVDVSPRNLDVGR